MENNSQTVSDCLSLALDSICESHDGIPIVGMSGPQGAGKTTALNELYRKTSKRVATLGIDDFYLTKSEREILAKEVSPLYLTRGPAGTHDIGIINNTIDALIAAEDDSRTPILQFDKVSDDRAPASQWSVFEGKPDIILLEGWLVGALATDDYADSPPVNDIEQQDHDSVWRKEQKKYLAGPYAELWNRFDAFIHIEAPSFKTIFHWRKQQEASNLGIAEAELTQDKIDWVRNFIQYYERLTIAMVEGHRRPGAVISLDENRTVVSFNTDNI